MIFFATFVCFTAKITGGPEKLLQEMGAIE
jgi:hypothetical protein